MIPMKYASDKKKFNISYSKYIPLFMINEFFNGYFYTFLRAELHILSELI